MVHTEKFKTLKSCCNAFHPADKAFSFSRMFLWLSLTHSKERILEKKLLRYFIINWTSKG